MFSLLHPSWLCAGEQIFELCVRYVGVMWLSLFLIGNLYLKFTYTLKYISRLVFKINIKTLYVVIGLNYVHNISTIPGSLASYMWS
jgi:hypothetical protein